VGLASIEAETFSGPTTVQPNLWTTFDVGSTTALLVLKPTVLV